MPEGVPLQSHSRPPAGRPFGGRRRLPRFLDPSTTSLARAPYAADRPGLPRFRPRGLSPPRRLPGSARACGSVSPRSRPWASSPFRAFPSRQVAHPSSGPLASLSFLPVEPRCGVRGLVARGLHRLGRRSGVVPGRILPRARGSLSAPLLAQPCGRTPRETSRSPWTSYAGLTSVRPFRRLRSFLPCASPFTPRGGHPHGLARGGRCSPGRSRPSRALLPPSLGSSFTRHGRRRPSSRWQRAPLGATRDSGDPRASVHPPGLRPECCGAGDPRNQVESCGDDRSVPRDPSAVTELFEPGPCRPSAATSTPMTFDARANPRPSSSARRRVAARERTRHDPGVRSPECLSILASVSP